MPTDAPTPDTPRSRTPTPMNRLGLDYRAEAQRLGPPPGPIIDAHSHINGARAARVYRVARDLYGVTTTYSMTQIQQAPAVREALGETVRFIAVPSYMDPDRRTAHTEGFLQNIQRWHDEFGSRIVKFWCAPRALDYGEEAGMPDLMRLDSEWRLRQMELAHSLGMMLMAHIADPDTWFATKYTDASRYGAKRDHYLPLERLADRFDTPWLIAHMGGWPEDLAFLDGLLDRHPNLHLDTSATKWMVRELSKHPRGRFVEFLEKHRGRIVFGSDIVTMDEHLGAEEGPRGMGAQASGEADAFDLYASRYWALRTLFETSYEGESPIADPDLALVEPGRYTEMDAPTLRGHALPPGLLRTLYYDAAAGLLESRCANV